MISFSKHCIQTRAYTSIHGFDEVLKPNTNYLFDLSYLSALTLEGEKPLEFLQGQISSDVRKVSATSSMPGAQCNLKGRILALMQVVSWQGIQLVIPKDLLEKTQLSLEKTALLSRVKLSEQKRFQLFGFYLQNPKDVLPVETPFPPELYAQVSAETCCYYHLGNGFYVFMVNQEQKEDFCKPFIDKEQFLGSLGWHTLMLKQHQIEIYPESRGLFLPHRLNLHETAYLAFDKGCYKGQEVIARMHYRATIKHEFRVLPLKTSDPIYLGQKLTHEGAEAGEVLDYSYVNPEDYLLAVSILKEAPAWVLLADHTKPMQLTLTN